MISCYSGCTVDGEGDVGISPSSFFHIGGGTMPAILRQTRKCLNAWIKSGAWEWMVAASAFRSSAGFDLTAPRRG